jgi:glucose-1-phosphate adenylyltransferase
MTRRDKFQPRRGPAPRVLGIVLAGGEGNRLMPLTADRAKPAVPIGGRYRLVDFVLSNLINSGVHKIKVLTQYKSDSLNTHLARGWHLAHMIDSYVEAVPAQMRIGRQWFRGSADALFQSMNVITDEDPDFVCVFSSDHIYKMDVRQMLDHHIESGADVTVAAIPVPVADARGFGVIGVDGNGRMSEFVEKPAEPPQMADRPGYSYASMGNYIWHTDALIEALRRDDAVEGSAHDFGKNIMPSQMAHGSVSVYDFSKNEIAGMDERERGYWRDVGTIASYHAANMDLVAVHPIFNLYNDRWPVLTWSRPLPPAKFVFSEGDRVGVATDSLVADGCIVSGGHVHQSVLSTSVRVNSYSYVEQCILFEGAQVGRHARLRRVIVDKNVAIPESLSLGYDHEADRRLGVTVLDDEDIVVVPKGHRFA